MLASSLDVFSVAMGRLFAAMFAFLQCQKAGSAGVVSTPVHMRCEVMRLAFGNLSGLLGEALPFSSAVCVRYPCPWFVAC